MAWWQIALIVIVAVVAMFGAYITYAIIVTALAARQFRRIVNHMDNRKPMPFDFTKGPF